MKCHRMELSIEGPFLAPAVPMRAVYRADYAGVGPVTEYMTIHGFGVVRERIVWDEKIVKTCPVCKTDEGLETSVEPLIYHEEYRMLTTASSYTEGCSNVEFVTIEEVRA